MINSHSNMPESPANEKGDGRGQETATVSAGGKGQQTAPLTGERRYTQLSEENRERETGANSLLGLSLPVVDRTVQHREEMNPYAVSCPPSKEPLSVQQILSPDDQFELMAAALQLGVGVGLGTAIGGAVVMGYRWSRIPSYLETATFTSDFVVAAGVAVTVGVVFGRLGYYGIKSLISRLVPPPD